MTGRAHRSEPPAEDRSGSPDEGGPRVDPGALLVALVLVPHSYPRNKFFSLFKRPEAKQIRRRAARLRSLVAGLLDDAEQVEVEREGDQVALRYQLRELGGKRTALLSEEELALVELATRRVDRALDLGATREAQARVMGALERLFAPAP